MRLCIFCGSKPGDNPAYAEAAAELGRMLARQQIGLVYGGASVGLMGVIADAALQAGGDVIGVIPGSLVDMEIAHPDLTHMHVVGSMHERKALMTDLSDGFIALPGGIGTLEELFEIWTWAQLGLHKKPYVLLNVAGYYNQLIGFLDEVAAAQFLKQQNRDMLIIASTPAEAIDSCLTCQAAAV